MNFIKNLFISKETKETLNALNKIGNEISEKYREKYLFELESVWEIISKEGKQIIYRNQKRLTQNVRENIIKPTEIILNMVNEISNSKLITGDNHTYRGLLNNFGKVYYDIFKFTLKKCVELNYITNEQRKILLEDLDENINSVG